MKEFTIIHSYNTALNAGVYSNLLLSNSRFNFKASHNKTKCLQLNIVRGIIIKWTWREAKGHKQGWKTTTLSWLQKGKHKNKIFHQMRNGGRCVNIVFLCFFQFASVLKGTFESSLISFSCSTYVLPAFHNPKVLKWNMSYIPSSYLTEAHENHSSFLPHLSPWPETLHYRKYWGRWF